MRKQLAVILTMAALAGACNERKDRDTGALDNERSGTDTVVNSETVKDTTVIQADTSIDVDTTKQTDHIDDSAKN